MQEEINSNEKASAPETRTHDRSLDDLSGYTPDEVAKILHNDAVTRGMMRKFDKPSTPQPAKTAHTPGPWRAIRTIVRYGCYGWEITHHEPRSNMPPQPVAWDRRLAFLDCDDEETRANAELIAAAPETAAELERVKQFNGELLAALRFIASTELTGAESRRHADHAIARSGGRAE